MPATKSPHHRSDATGSPPAGSDELALSLRLAIGRLARRLRRHTVGGLTAAECSVLASVERDGPIRPSDLADREGVSPPTLSRVMGRLEARGHLVRAADPGDGRCSLMALSATGAEALQAIRDERTALLARSLAELAPDQQARVAAAVPALHELIEVMRSTRPIEPSAGAAGEGA